MIIGLVSSPEVIYKRFEAAVPEKLNYVSNFNLRPGNEMLFLSSAKPTEFVSYRFGMTPFFSKTEKLLYEAPVEGEKLREPGDNLKVGIILSPNFRKPIREQRGLLPVDYFIVQNWQGKPYIIFMRDKKRPFALGCVWDAWKKEITDPLNYGFAVLSTPSYGEFAKIGIGRIPLIIPENRYKRWLKTDDMLNQVTDLMDYYDQKQFNAYPISNEILTSEANEKTIIAPVGELVIQDKKEEYIYKPHGFKAMKSRNQNSQTTWGERVEKYGK